ncbi:3-oxoacyl-[acyl-carrier protein] reductase [Vibrio sp. JCM 18904]|nr:3-oxoacyl-[acyl-carrier protein] reductase [Vibrio sp. JCM 18904]
MKLISFNNENLEKLEIELKNKYSSCEVDITSVDFNNPYKVEDIMKSMINNCGDIDVLVNSVGVLSSGGIDLSLTSLSEMMNVNLLSTMIVCNLIADKMKKQGYGEIYNLGSTAGLEPVSKIAAYSATKAAIVSYSKSLYYELLPFGVKVCCLCPSVVNTDMTNDGRIDNNLKIETEDIAKALGFVRGLSTGATISTIEIRCIIMDLEN